MTRVAGIAVLLVAAMVQVTWAPRLMFHGAFPNLVLVIVVIVTWTGGQRSGLLLACAGGLLLDLTAPGPLGPHAVALLVVAYLTGFWVRNVDPAGLVQPAIAAAMLTAVYSLVLVGVDDTLGLPVPPIALAAQLAVAAALYNGVLVPPALIAMRLVRREAAT